MACITSLEFCQSVAVSIECYKQIFADINTDIIFTLIDNQSYPIDLDSISEICIKMYDSRNISIITYIYPEQTHIDVNNIWFMGLPIKILQEKITDSLDEEIINKGKFSISITEELSNYLMVGTIYVDMKIIYNNETVIIKCFKIGQLVENKFKI